MLNPIEGEPKDFGSRHKKFEIGRPHELSREEALTLRAIKECLEQGRRWSNEFNQRLGKIYIERVASLALAKKSGQERDQAQSNIKRVEAFYKTIYPDERDFLTFRNGFLAEFAVARSLQNSGFDVYYPSVQEDVKRGLDWWITGERISRPVAAQVKCLSLREDPRGHIVIPINPQKHEEATDQILDWFGYAVRDEVGLARSVKHLADYCRGEAAGSRAACVFLPSPESRFAYFSVDTGEPSEDLDYQLATELITRVGKEADYGQTRSQGR